MTAPFSVIIPTLNAAETLPSTLNALLPGLETGMIRELILSDGGSTDATVKLGEQAGATVLVGSAGRGSQLRRGADIARAEWLLFVHADTHLPPDWVGALGVHIKQQPDNAAVFRLKFRARGPMPRLFAAWANLRSRLFDLPYGDQALLISRRLYDVVGGYPNQPLMEDVAIARKLKARITLLDAAVQTGADRYIKGGWVRRGLRNLWTLARYLWGVSPAELAAMYHKP